MGQPCVFGRPPSSGSLVQKNWASAPNELRCNCVARAQNRGSQTICGTWATLCAPFAVQTLAPSICPRLWKSSIQQLQPLTSFRLFNRPRKCLYNVLPDHFFERGHCRLSSKGNREQDLVQKSAFSSYPPSFNLFVPRPQFVPPVESTHIRFKSDPSPLTESFQFEFYALSSIGEDTCKSRVMAEQVMTITADIEENMTASS